GAPASQCPHTLTAAGRSPAAYPAFKASAEVPSTGTSAEYSPDTVTADAGPAENTQQTAANRNAATRPFLAVFTDSVMKHLAIPMVGAQDTPSPDPRVASAGCSPAI